MERLKYGPGYLEKMTLRDGRKVLLRLVRSTDRELIQEGFQYLSDRSRKLRFHGVKNALTQEDLSYLTQLDGNKHFAIGAIQNGYGVGIARFIRSDENPSQAEPAIVVTDLCQSQGLGKILLQHLVEAAIERGITEFRCDVLVENGPMRHLLKEICPDAIENQDGTTVSLIVPLEDTQKSQGASSHSVMEQILMLAAKGALCVLGAPRERLLNISEVEDQAD